MRGIQWGTFLTCLIQAFDGHVGNVPHYDLRTPTVSSRLAHNACSAV